MDVAVPRNVGRLSHAPMPTGLVRHSASGDGGTSASTSLYLVDVAVPRDVGRPSHAPMPTGLVRHSASGDGGTSASTS